MTKFYKLAGLCIGFLFSCTATNKTNLPQQFSGIYPHLAMYNDEGECGTGAVVPWAGKLWVVTYGPHMPYGSSDKLYEITPDLKQIIREESIGGTPANRMIHPESQQLFIGPYAIDSIGGVRVIPYTDMPGRHTGNARHLTDPANRIYVGTMEEGFYDLDVKTLVPKLLYEDGNVTNKKKLAGITGGSLLPGAHGKGLYSGQGVMVYSNNGESGPEALKHFDIKAGSLSEWDGKTWTLVRRNQFVEVTGPGGIYGNKHPETDPIWATGWDHKSVLLGVRDDGKWSFYRLPKASHSYDGAHGWNTEWPRIRDVGTSSQPDYLMTMHGMFWKFPGSFSSGNSAGIRPRSAYLKVIGDFARWNDQLVFGCDDAAHREFLNKRKAKGGIEGPGQSNSNLWFTSVDKPSQLGPNTAEGAVWLSENIEKDKASEPFLFAGWAHRMAWVLNEGKIPVSFSFEIDKEGTNKWTPLRSVDVAPGESLPVVFENIEGEWIRVVCNESTKATVHFSYTDTGRFPKAIAPIFNGLATLGDDHYSGGLMYGLGDNRRALGILAGDISGEEFHESGYYELNADMKLEKKDDVETADFIREKFAIPGEVVTIDESSVLVIDDEGRRWRLPLGDPKFTEQVDHTLQRVAREVATERDLMNIHGTFYELPAENADGYAKIRPIASHSFTVHDYTSYRGLLVLTGLSYEGNEKNTHIIRSEDGKASVWVGAIDDLWQLGKPVGHGGPWKDSPVEKGSPSDPYLIGFYHHRTLSISHQSAENVTFTFEVDPIGHGPWMVYKTITVKPGETYEYTFPEDFQSRWIRFRTDKNTTATTSLTYK